MLFLKLKIWSNIEFHPFSFSARSGCSSSRKSSHLGRKHERIAASDATFSSSAFVSALFIHPRRLSPRSLWDWYSRSLPPDHQPTGAVLRTGQEDFWGTVTVINREFIHSKAMQRKSTRRIFYFDLVCRNFRTDKSVCVFNLYYNEWSQTVIHPSIHLHVAEVIWY